jgi:DNA ligase (NAD+)
MGRTGVLTPVAVFEPIEIDGTTVERANLHNINVLRDTLGSLPHKGQKLQIYKSNMIIPQVYSADKERKDDSYYVSHTILNVPNLCPYCQGSTQIIANDDSQVLVCTNSNCDSKLINRLDHFCGKKGLDIKGISKATLSTLIEKGWVSSLYDIFGLKEHKTEWINTAGFGKKSVENILEAIEAAKETDLTSFISSLGISLIGPNVAKDLTKKFNSYESFREAIKNNFDFGQLNGFAENKTKALLEFNYEEADKIFKLLNIKKKEKEEVREQTLEGKTIVVTGKLNQFKNRNELQDKIVSLGGKLSNNISNKTFCLINNDTFSTSNKNKFAKDINIPILTEKEFIEKYLTF